MVWHRHYGVDEMGSLVTAQCSTARDRRSGPLFGRPWVDPVRLPEFDAIVRFSSQFVHEAGRSAAAITTAASVAVCTVAATCVVHADVDRSRLVLVRHD